MPNNGIGTRRNRQENEEKQKIEEQQKQPRVITIETQPDKQ